MTPRLTTDYAKNYCNRALIFKLIVENVVTCFLLGHSVEGPAGQVLCDAGQCTSAEDLIRLLKSRFDSLNEEERYRSELKARRRRRGESLQSVYQDVRRLMSPAFPGHSGTM